MMNLLEPSKLLALAILLISSVAMAQRTPDASSSSVGKDLGSYEKSALRLALATRKLTIEASPEGKRVGEIHVLNLDVFGKAEGFLQYLNFLHVTTHERVIAREMLLQPGDLWDEDLVYESIRRIKDPLFTSLVVIVPIQSKDAESVDLLIVTRDVWSLRMNSVFELFQGTVTRLQLSVAENNILGLRKHGALVFDMDQGKISIGPQYIDKALLGTRLKLNTKVRANLSRETREFEGTSSAFRLDYPLWSLQRKWGGSFRFQHFDSPVRVFRGTEVQRLDNPDTEEVEEIERLYRDRRLAFRTSAVRSTGSSTKHRFTFGHVFSVVRPRVGDDFSGSASDEEFLRNVVFPRSERSSLIFLQYNLFSPDFVVYRNLNSFDLAEDVRLGPELTIGLNSAITAIGSQRNYFEGTIGAAWTLDLAEDGFVRAATGAETRLQYGEFVDNFFSTSLKIAAPRIANAFRIVGKVNLKLRLREQGNATFLLGGSSGLRGYVISEFEGQKQFLTNLEIRSMPAKVLFARVGVLAFWDMGHAAPRVEDLRLKHGIGVGLRTLFPQLQPFVFRFDWAFPLASENAGFPGRFSVGVAQAF